MVTGDRKTEAQQWNEAVMEAVREKPGQKRSAYVQRLASGDLDPEYHGTRYSSHEYDRQVSAIYRAFARLRRYGDRWMSGEDDAPPGVHLTSRGTVHPIN